MEASIDQALPTVLVVDDEQSLRDSIRYVLGHAGFRVITADTGQQAIHLARSEHPDVVVLDVLMADLNGFQVCRVLRAESTVPILLLSARGEEIDRVTGLDLGADDYLTKPFAMAELLARVRALLRRARMTSPESDLAELSGNGHRGSTDATRTSALLTVGDVSVDPARRYATLDGRRLSLKPKEFDLLHYFARHPGIVVSRTALLREVWGYDFPMETRTVDVHVRWLRQKIEDEPARPRRIETVRGHGYRFLPDERT